MTAFRCVVLGAVALVLGGPLGCALSGQVEDDKKVLAETLEEIDARARICAPRELAEARANLAFAVYEADEGQSIRSHMHLADAERLAVEAADKSKGDDCEPDRDLDGIRDSKDKCPTEPEDYDGHEDEDGCPDYDRDGDGISDDRDRCPDHPEDKDGFQDEDGCPESDNDRDGILDANDKCPNQPEDKDGFQDIDGCPDPDNDQDGIPDTLDKCPNDAEDMDGDQDEDGCPDLYENIRVVGDRIELNQQIFFALGRAKIRKKSYRMLNEVADVLMKNPSMRVRIEGHTDTRGSDRRNLKLSERRAASVRTFMIEAGVQPSRIFAKGFGETRLLKGTKGKDKRNRRVEFHITSK